MKKAVIALLVVIGVVYYPFSGDDEVPITKCIGLHPDLDKIRDRFNRDTVRNLVYENTSSDPLFYSKIVHKIESCDWVISKDLFRRENVDGDIFALAGSRYREDSLREKTAFISTDWAFQCVVYNGDEFVLLVLTALY